MTAEEIIFVSKWFEDAFDKKDLAEKMKAIDAFMHTHRGDTPSYRRSGRGGGEERYGSAAPMIAWYSGIVPKGDLVLFQRLGEKLKNKSFLHVNSTRAGGGVAEIPHRMMPILADLGINARWEVIEGDQRFFEKK